MRILLHCVYYPPEVGGLESHVSDLARGLAARGHEVRVVTSRSRAGLAREEVLDGVRVRRTWLPGRTAAGWTLHAVGSVPITRRWAGWAQVIHAQAFASVVPAGLAARGRERPWAATFHTSHFLMRAERRLWRPFLGALVRWPDHALAASREIAGVAETLAPGRPVEALTNGVETERFRPTQPAVPPEAEVRRIVVPRRLFPKNGVEFLVRAMPLVREELPGTVALVVGDGPERGRLEALAGRIGAGEAVRFLGTRTHDEMPAHLCSGEVAVFPSLMEATSVAALEAMACGRPVVATRVGGLPEIVDDEVGHLVPPADPRALARGIVELLRRDDLARMGERARARVVARWSNARLVERHLEIYGALLEGRRVPEPSPVESA